MSGASFASGDSGRIRPMAFGASGIEGGTGRIKPQPKLCGNCGGSGYDGEPAYGYVCESCNGTGEVRNSPRGIDWGMSQ